MEQPTYPKSRHSGLLVDHVGDETIIYDESRQEAHSLNRSASIVWQNSDGAHSVNDLATLLGNELGTAPDESIVEYALDKLANAHLLEDSTVSRRDLVRRLTLAGAAAVVLPAVLSVATPSAAMASSGQPTSNNQGNQNQNGQH